MATVKGKCPMCGKFFSREVGAKACMPCAHKRVRIMDQRRRKASAAVHRAVLRGELAPASTCTCVDCGVQAFCYDHRDYSKPLDVQPVCKRCNCIRGPGKPYDGHDYRWQKRFVASAKRSKQTQPV